jgi:hypothetical protein
MCADPQWPGALAMLLELEMRDQAVLHEAQARDLKKALEKRFADCGPDLHPIKTKIVYCKDDDRRGNDRKDKFAHLDGGLTSRGMGSFAD